MQRTNRFFAAVMTAAVLGTTIIMPFRAAASEEGKRNTTLGLGAASAALLLTQKNKLPGLLAAGGAVYAGTQYQRDINRRHARERAAAYERGRRTARYHRAHRVVHHRKVVHHRYAHH